jgi:hypothetical protein
MLPQLLGFPPNLQGGARLPLPTETRYDQGDFQSWHLTNIIRERYARDLPPYMQSLGRLVQSKGSTALDASCLLVPLMR